MLTPLYHSFRNTADEYFAQICRKFKYAGGKEIELGGLFHELDTRLFFPVQSPKPYPASPSLLACRQISQSVSVNQEN